MDNIAALDDTSDSTSIISWYHYHLKTTSVTREMQNLRAKIRVSKDLFCTFIFKQRFLIHFHLKMTLSKRRNVVAF